MPKFPFVQVDAFTTTPLHGNPCAIIFDADALDDATMLAIAKENNLSETSFVRKSSVADVGARYFTTAEEIPLAGHPTIATIFALVDAGRIKLTGDHTQLSLELRAGLVPIDIYTRNGDVQRIVMSQLKPKFLRTYAADEIAPYFGLSADDVLPNAPIQTVSTGTPMLMVAVKDLDVLRRVRPNMARLAALRAKGDFFSPHVFCVQGVTPQGRTFARQFGASPDDVWEDPFTGSATGSMGAYLWHYNLIDSPNFIAEQGHWMGRPGMGYVEVVGPRDDIETVKVGGSAVTVIRGELTI